MAETETRDWKPASELSVNPRVTTCIDVRQITTYRWKPYAADGARPVRAQGRWQRATGSGDYIRWVNCPRPLGEWSPNGDAMLAEVAAASVMVAGRR